MRFSQQPLRRQRPPPPPHPPHPPPNHTQPPPGPATSRRRRKSRINPTAALQTHTALLLTLALIALRTHVFHTTKNAISRQALPLTATTTTPRPPPSLHIFTVPKPFRGPDAAQQLRALETWLALTPRPTVTLIGAHASVADTARRYSILHQPRVDTSFLGLPLLPAILAVCRTSVTDVSVLANADILLFDDFSLAVRKLAADFNHAWTAVAARWDVNTTAQALLRGAHARPPESARRAVVEHARRSGSLHTYGGVDVWAWHGTPPFLQAYTPPFAFGRGRYDNWLTHRAIADGLPVVDISQAVTAVHVAHDHHLVGAPAGTSGEFWNVDSNLRFETVVNAHLAALHGSYHPQDGTALHAPFKLATCVERQALCLFRRARPHACRCEHSPFVNRAHNDPYRVPGSSVVFCGLLRSGVGEDDHSHIHRWAISGRTAQNARSGPPAFGLPLTQADVLTLVANRSQGHTVFMLAAEHADRALLMETVCSMRAVGIFFRLVVVALDDDLYRFAITRGLPVFLAEFDDADFEDHANFRELARLQTVLEALQTCSTVVSLLPGVVFTADPSPQLRTRLSGRELGLLRALSEHNDGATGQSRRLAVAPVLFARSSAATLHALQHVMGVLEHRHDRRLADILLATVCGDGGEGAREGGCWLGDGKPVVHLFDVDWVRPVETRACGACDKATRPGVWFSVAAGVDGRSAEALQSLRSAGLARTVEASDVCDLHT